MFTSSTYFYQNDALGSMRLVTASTGAILFSSDYLPFGASFGTSGSFTPEFEYTGKLVDLTGLYYYGARFYDPSIDRFVTEDTSTGSLEDPQSLDRYVYARDDPEAITDPTGHGWWSSLTSAVSNGANTLASDATSVGQDIVSAASNPENQAIALTVGVDALAVGAVALDVGTGGLATTLPSAAIGAAISTTMYTVTSGGHATLSGALESAGTGAVLGAATAGMGELFGGAGAIEESAISMTPQEIGDVGEGALANDVGGVSQEYMPTNLGGGSRYT